MAYIGLDIGTSSCKAAVYTEAGIRVAEASASYRLHTPRQGMAELDPGEIWACVQQVLGGIASHCSGDTFIAISGIGESFVLVDANGDPLNRFITYLDDRGDASMQEIRSVYSDWELFQMTGVRPNKTYSLVRMHWIYKNQPELLKQAAYVMFYNEYFAYRLTGLRATDPGCAVRSMLVNAGGRSWNADLLKLVGLAEENMSPILETGSLLGSMKAELAQQLGFGGNVQVLVGCHDQLAAVLGAGCWNLGDAILGEGSSESLNLVVSPEATRPTQALYDSEIVAEPFLEGKNLLIAAQSAFCTNLQWFMRNINEDGQSSGENFERWDARCPEETELFFVPYLSALNVMDSDTPVHGAFLGLRFSSTREEMYRAVLEGMHMESRRNFETMCALGVPMGRLIANGGNSRSARSMQIKAGIYRREIETLESPDAGVVGLAMICAVAAGAMDYETAIRRFIRPGKCYSPDRDYEEKYARYLNYTQCLRAAEKEWNKRKKEFI